MGLTSWKGSPDGRIHSSDVTVAKNYLNADEIDQLNQLVSGFLDAAELRVRNHTITTMADCAALCEQYISLTGGKALEGKGRRNKKQADQKVKDEFRKFNKTQESDFHRFVKQVQNKVNTTK
ncbi:RhuM family protein [Bifidobacterium sp. ESL0728]|uniref:RhuM family protein n=1 Tax=Bifidobacterium sp. ESL0728 TaxID=2983220 RepID=UPI0023F8DC20|nr:RhuM family protein [Bifidobacterium sp. ESL0728]WEV59363.1 RhuM family protein [Bifidobacterium sp. ESL0728]